MKAVEAPVLAGGGRGSAVYSVGRETNGDLRVKEQPGAPGGYDGYRR